MKTFRRLKNIINSNVNSALDQMENPEKMIKLMVNELEESLFKAKKGRDAHMIEKRTLDKEVTDLEATLKRWEERASLAVEKERDDLAKEALVEKKKTQKRIEGCKEHRAAIEKILLSEDESITQLSEKLKEIKEKQMSLVSRARHAQEKKKVQETIKQTESYDFKERFNELESKIEQMESSVNATNYDTVSEFETLEINKEIDEELEALKAKMKNEDK